MTIRAAIFDMDGLMLDTEPRYRSAWQQALAEFGYSLSDVGYLPLVGLKRPDAEQAVLRMFGPNFPIEQFRVVCRKLEADAMVATPIEKKPGVDELLAFLEARKIPLAVATSTDRVDAMPRLSNAGILYHFRVIATGDEVTRGKPNPDLYLLAASRLRIDPQFCLVLEDSEAGGMAAHAAGMQVYVVPDLKPPSADLVRVANGVFKTLTAVREHLESASFESPGNIHADKNL